MLANYSVNDFTFYAKLENMWWSDKGERTRWWKDTALIM
jgi:hypothetical protein